MTGDQVLKRLQAWASGRPIPRGSTRHIHIATNRDVLILSFVRMGGESAPWGIAHGHPGDNPTVLTVPEARNRTLVADMAAAFAPTLLEHFRHPGYAQDTPTGPKEPRALRQLWVPNPTHLEMLHCMAYAYTFTRVGERDRAKTLNKLGRVAGWLFREANRPGQQTVVVASDALRDAYTFPAEDVRQAHLGFLLAWLASQGGREAGHRAASEAEQHAVATSLDPSVEREELQDAVDAWNEAERNTNSKDKSLATRIDAILGRELNRRWKLTEQAIELLRRDNRSTNPGVDRLISVSNEESWYQYVRQELKVDDEQDGPAITLSPETDRYPALAASRYFVHEASEELYLSSLLHDDEEMQREAIAEGQAIRGKITAVEDVDPGRRLEPIWTIRIGDDAPLRIREGSWLCVAGLPKRTARVRSIRRAAPGALDVQIEITGWKKKPKEGPPGVLATDDPRLVGQDVTLIPSSSEGMFRRKSQKAWQRETPGGWLTHRAPKEPAAALPDDVGEDLDALQKRFDK